MTYTPAVSELDTLLDSAGLYAIPAGGGGIAVTAQGAYAHLDGVQKNPMNGTLYPHVGAALAAARKHCA